MAHILSWKYGFYHALIPLARALGPARGDALLATMGRAVAAWPSRRRKLDAALDSARAALDTTWPEPATRHRLAENLTRYLSRDYTLEGASDQALAARFDVAGFDVLQTHLGQKQGVILLGCHFGAHLAGVHWLMRSKIPLRVMVQQPKHASSTLQAWFKSQTGPPHPQSAFLLQRGMNPTDAVRRVFLAREALRAGQAVYLNGDVTWSSPSARWDRLLGRTLPFLSLWADLASATRAPVIPVWCRHRPQGRFQLTFDAPYQVTRGAEAAAQTSYLLHLEKAIAADPAEAVPYLTWPTYQPATWPAPPQAKPTPHARPSAAPLAAQTR